MNTLKKTVMKLRKYQPLSRDNEILTEWFKFYDWKPCDVDLISPESYFVENNEGDSLAFSGLYLIDGVPMAVLGFTIKNPFKGTSESIDFLLNELFKIAEKKGIKTISYFTDSKSMVDRLNNKHEMTITDNGNAYILLKVFNNSDCDFLK
jgi:hypothetical protein